VAVLERFHDADGAAIVGWLGERVLYARFEGAISSEVGRQLARRLLALIGDVTGIVYFDDQSSVTGYDRAANAWIVDALLAKREQLERIVALPPLGPSVEARGWSDAIECLEPASSAADFEARLRAAASEASLRQVTMLVDPGPHPAHDATAPRAERARRPAPADGTYTYVFELDAFEEGQFTATRCTYLATRPRGAWVCVARSDEQALALARQAALLEWALPRTRAPQDFTVHFLDASERAPFKRRR
jgi:hypothetical protein